MKLPDNAVADSLLLRGKVIPVLSCELPQAELLFYPENPRIYSAVRAEGDGEPSQEEIFRILSKAEHVRETLVPSIRNNGGLIEPILVRGNVVLEGNSRLAAYRLLSQNGDTAWSHIRARVLPAEITDSEVFSLLGEYHMVGKKDWMPYEQAGYLFRRYKLHEVTPELLASEVGLTKAKVSHLIAVYQFMVDHEDRSPERWSYYDELLKGRSFKDAHKLYPEFYEVIAEKIHGGEIRRAVDLRDQLPLITKAGGNTLRRFIKGALTFDDAAEDAKLRGAGNYHAKKLKSFREWIAESSIDGELDAMSEDEVKNVKYQLEKIRTRIAQLLSRATKPRAR